MGVPHTMIMDGHSAQVNIHLQRLCQHVGTIMSMLETSTSWSNWAELYIGLFKEAVRKNLIISNSTMVR